MVKPLLVRFTLLVTCMLVCIPGGHIAFPMGFSFLRFLNPRYPKYSTDWLILSLLCVAVAASATSLWRGGRPLILFSILAYSAVIVLVQNHWVVPRDWDMLFSAVPFVAASVWSLVQKQYTVQKTA